MIRAGTLAEVTWDSGTWIFLDIGFSKGNKTCGLAFANRKPDEVCFGEAVEQISRHISNARGPFNLVIEAPLSVAFNSAGNPAGRKLEHKPGHGHRYWYTNIGCTVMVASLYLIKKIADTNPVTEVRLFEGFVSFKPKSYSGKHSEDVELLRNIVKKPKRSPEEVISPDELKQQVDRLESAFAVMGMNLGIPPIIKVCWPENTESG